MIRQSLAAVPPLCPPGTCHSYQNIAYDTIREVMETATHRVLRGGGRQRLFLPLGMTSATIGLGRPARRQALGPPSRTVGRDHALADAYYRVPAAAGVNSNIVDLARWMQAQMGQAPAVLPAEVLADIQRPRQYRPALRQLAAGPDAGASGYGLGMRSFTYKGHRLVGHSGGGGRLSLDHDVRPGHQDRRRDAVEQRGQPALQASRPRSSTAPITCRSPTG
jgi:beta-lactamase class C